MKQKGFTLIELLAVIVVLAVITLIAVPMVLNIIEKSKEGTAVDSAYGYIHAIEQGVTVREIKDKVIVSNGEYTNLREFENENNITLKGTKPSSGTFTLEKRRIISSEFIINGYRVTCDKKTCRTSGKSEKVIVTYNPNGGTLSKENDILYSGDTIELPIPTPPTNYSFAGWYTQSDGKGELINNDSVIMSDLTLYAYYVQTVTEFTYTGSEQTFIVPATGKYKLEAWGAQGGSGSNTGKTAVVGGKGGYSVGSVELTKNSSLYVYVGGEGPVTSTNLAVAYHSAFPNGGAVRSLAAAQNILIGGGGGSSHIASENKTIAELGTDNPNLYIVAGGGGGSANYWDVIANGGVGGGLAGADTTSNFNGINATGGTQIAAGLGGGNQDNYSRTGTWLAGAFGQGGGATTWGSSSSTSVSGGGGGGYYGGGASWGGSGAGGSSYIGGVIDGSTIAGNASMPTHDGASTMTGNTGNGYAKITYLGE